MKTILGVKGWDLSEYAISANAILGIRDSGKTYTGTEAAEELYDAGVPFIAFDPIGVWHSLRIPGKGKGYPVVVAGGKHGDLPLSVKTAGAIVRAAMSAEVSLVLDLFSIELSKADWKRIVRECVEILLHENVEHGLRHVFIEEAAEFVPQRVSGIDGQVFAAVEKLVRMGGNSKLGCTLINQRSADLNKSVLELCANVFVHRQTGKNTMLDLKKWFEQLALDKAEQAGIADTLPNLKSGECWAFINDLKKPIRLKVPEKNSLHPDRRAVIAKGQEKSKPVPADAFVAQMTAKLAEKDKPKAAPASQPVVKISTPDSGLKNRDAAFQLGLKQGRDSAYSEGYLAGHAAGYQLGAQHLQKSVQTFVRDMAGPVYAAPQAPRIPKSNGNYAIPMQPVRQASPAPSATVTREANGLPGPQQRILDSLLTWKEMGHSTPSNAQVAWLAGYSPSSTSYTNPRSALKSAGLLEYPAPDRASLTPQGEKMAGQIVLGGDLLEYVLGQLRGPERRILEAAAHFHPNAASNDDVANRADYSASSTSYTNPRSALKSKELLIYPARDQVRAADWLFS